MSPTDGGAGPTGFVHLDDREVFAGVRLRVVNARFRAPDGEEFDRDIVRNQGAVAVVPLLDDGRTVLVIRQYRGPIERELLEIPAGLLDVEGEPPEECARRELVEEVGHEATDVEHLLTTFVAAGFSDHYVSIYLATGLRAVAADRQGPEERHMVVEELALDDVPGLIASGELVDAKTIIGLMAVRARLDRDG